MSSCPNCDARSGRIDSWESVYLLAQSNPKGHVHTECYGIDDTPFGRIEFSILLALDLVKALNIPAKIVPEEIVEHVIRVNQHTPEHVDHVGDEPGIIVHINVGNTQTMVLLIDGTHRALKCRRDGKPFMAHVLNHEQSVMVIEATLAAKGTQ